MKKTWDIDKDSVREIFKLWNLSISQSSITLVAFAKNNYKQQSFRDCHEL